MLDSTSQNNNISSERLKFNNVFSNFNDNIDKTSLFTFLKTLFRELVTYPYRVFIQQPKYLKDFQNRITHIKIEQTDNLASLERKKTIIEQNLVVKELLEKKGFIKNFNSIDKQKVQNLHQLLDSFNAIINYLSAKKDFINESSSRQSVGLSNPNPCLTSITDNADDNSLNGDEVSADADDTSPQEPVVAPSDIEPPKLSEAYKIEEIKQSQVPENIISPSSDSKQDVSNIEPEKHWFKAGIITALAGGMFAINKFSSNFIQPTTVSQVPQEPSFISGVNLTEIVNATVPAAQELLSTLSNQVHNVSNTIPIASTIVQDFFRVTQNLTTYVAQNSTKDVVQNFTTQLQEVIVSQTDRIQQNQSEIALDQSISGQCPNSYLLSLGAIALAALSAHLLWQAYKKRAANAPAPQAPQNPEPTISNNNTNVGGTDPNLPNGTSPVSEPSGDPVGGEPAGNGTQAGSEPSDPVGEPTGNVTQTGSEAPSDPVEGKPTDNVTQPGSEAPSDPVEGKPTDNVTQSGSETPSDHVGGESAGNETKAESETPSDPVGNETIDNETEPKIEASDPSLHQAFIEFPNENNQTESKQEQSIEAQKQASSNSQSTIAILSNPVRGEPAGNETKAKSETPSDPIGNETIDNETEPKIEAPDPSLHQAFIEFPKENNQTESKQEQSNEAQKQASSNSQPIERVMDENEIASFFSSVKNNSISGTNLGSANTNEPPSEAKTGESDSLNDSFYQFDEPQENATTTAQQIYNVAGQVMGGVTGALSGVNQVVRPYLTSPEAEKWKLHRYTTAIQMLRLLLDNSMQLILKDLESYFKSEPIYEKFAKLRKILESNPDKLDSRKQYQAFVEQTREVLLELEKNNHGIPKYLEDKIHIMNAKWFTKNTLGTFFTKMVFYVGTLKLENKEQIIEHFDKLPLSEKMEILLEGIDKVPSKEYIAHQTAKLGTILNGFDPLKYSNMPSQWSKCTYENNKGETLTKIHMRTGMPTGPKEDNGWFANLNPFSSAEIRLVPEYLSFWRGLKAQNKKLLVILRLDPKYFDVQNGEMKKDSIKLTQAQLHRQGLWIKMINDAAQSEEFKDTVKVAVLPLDGAWIEHDIQHFEGEQSKEQFLSKLEADILNPKNGFLFPPPLESKEDKEKFVKEAIEQVAKSYFSKIVIFNKGTMTAFVSLLQSQLSEALHFLTEADVIQENCKDAIDRTAAIKGAQLLEMLCRLGRLADKALHDIIIGTIIGPALAVLKRALLKGRRPILLETIKFLEQNTNTNTNYHPVLPGGYVLKDVSLKTDDWQTLFRKDLEIEDLTKALHSDRRFLQIIKNQEEDFSKLISKPTNAKLAQAKRASGLYYDLFKNMPEVHKDKTFRQGFISSIIKSTTSEVIDAEIEKFKTERSEDFKSIKTRRLSLLKSSMSEKSQKVTEKKEKRLKALKN